MTPLKVESKKKLTDSQTSRTSLIAGAGLKQFRERLVREFEMDMYTLPYLKWITNDDSLSCIHSELCSMLYGSLMEEFRGIWRYTYVVS